MERVTWGARRNFSSFLNDSKMKKIPFHLKILEEVKLLVTFLPSKSFEQKIIVNSRKNFRTSYARSTL